MAVTELEYGDPQSKREYKEQRKRYEQRKKQAKKKAKKKAETTAQRGISNLAKRGREIDELVEELKK